MNPRKSGASVGTVAPTKFPRLVPESVDFGRQIRVFQKIWFFGSGSSVRCLESRTTSEQNSPPVLQNIAQSKFRCNNPGPIDAIDLIQARILYLVSRTFSISPFKRTGLEMISPRKGSCQ